MRVPTKLSRRVPEKCRISVSSGKMVESGRVLEKGRIGASTEKHSRQVPEKVRICVSTKKMWNLGEYREKVEFVRVPKNCPDDYLKRVE